MSDRVWWGELPKRELPADTPRWNDSDLFPEGEGGRIARYRRLQSWYRETVLGVAPGVRKDKPGKRLGSLLASAEHGENFLTRQSWLYSLARREVVTKAGGTLEPHRLDHNLLSSMPLCFNLFGELREHRDELAAALRKHLMLDVERIPTVEVEYAPPRSEHLGDRTAFDAFIEYERSDGKLGFLGVETKYTEPFSREAYEGPEERSYASLTRREWGFLDGAAEQLMRPATNQLWRNCLLSLSLRHSRPYAESLVVVLACNNDSGVEKAMDGFRSQHTDPESVVRALTLEDFVGGFRASERLGPWAAAFTRRYLDLAPVGEN